MEINEIRFSNHSSPVGAIVRKEIRILFENRGLSLSQFLATYHLDGGLSDEADATTSPRHVADVLRKAAEYTRCTHLGLALGQLGGLDSLGEPGLAIAQASTLRQALTTLEACFNAQERGAILDLTLGDVTSLRYVILDPAIESGAIISDWAISLVMQVLADLCGRRWRPELVELPRRAPTDCQPYRSVFKCPIAFNAAGAAIHFDGADLDRPLALRSIGAITTATAPAQRPAAPDVSRRVLDYLARGIATGTIMSAEHIASHLNMCGRSLQRELTKARTSYRVLFDEFRFGLSRRLLCDTDMPVTDIALALGYADTSVLTRAFTRWAGICPSGWRTAVRRNTCGTIGVDDVSAFYRARMAERGRLAEVA